MFKIIQAQSYLVGEKLNSTTKNLLLDNKGLKYLLSENVNNQDKKQEKFYWRSQEKVPSKIRSATPISLIDITTGALYSLHFF